MSIRSRLRRRIYWPFYHHGFPYHHAGSYCPYSPPPPPQWIERPTREEEVEDLKEHIEMLKDELKAAEEDLKELEKTK